MVQLLTSYTDGKLIKEYDSIKQAVEDMGSNCKSSIIACLKGRNKTSMGFEWRYIESEICD
jgi:hypothetical protein